MSVIIVCCFTACNDGDHFSSDPDLRLSFSTDTVRFDTIFSTIGSTTRQLKVYNRNSNSLSIQKIELMNPSNSGFRINVNGERGTTFSDIDILKKDSMFVFVEVTVNPSNQSNPLLIRDSIRFTTNGNIQYIQLEAVGQDVHIWQGRTITQDTILTNDKPFLISDSLVIAKDVTVTINKGTRFFFRRNASLDIHGTLKTLGSIQEPVIFRADRFGYIDGSIPYDNVSGQWEGVVFYAESFGNHLENLFIRNATRGVTFLESDPQYKKAVLINTKVHNTSQYGVSAVNCNIDAQNCLFTNSRGATFTVLGGAYTITHSTIANYYTWSARQSQALVISNISNSNKNIALTKFDIANSIVYGSLTQELVIQNSTVSEFNYKFTNCLLRMQEQSSPSFINTIWNANPLFTDINSSGLFNYNFELQQQSPAIDKGDRAYALSVPFDLNGNSRLNDLNPDIGCYEWIAK